jgi:SAM-dependent methyltransferase
MADQHAGTRIREQVRTHYAAAAAAVTAGTGTGCGPGGGTSCCATHLAEQPGLGAALYTVAERDQLPPDAVAASLGCGNPVAVADLHAGETVLDLGSGGGIDVLLSARRVGPAGKAYGLDMTEEMLALAERNAAGAGVTNVEFLKGYLEAIPLPAAAVDVVISNCVINLSADVGVAETTALRPGAVSG